LDKKIVISKKVKYAVFGAPHFKHCYKMAMYQLYTGTSIWICYTWSKTRL